MPTKRKPKPNVEAVRAVAERIAAELFRNYEGDQVDFLVLTSVQDEKRTWGSYSEVPVADVIEKHLKRSRLTRRKGRR